MASVADEERGMLDSLVDDKATAGAQKPADDVHKARALGADGGADSGGLDDKTEAGAGAEDEACRRENGDEKIRVCIVIPFWTSF